jgi:uncharacterized protein
VRLLVTLIAPTLLVAFGLHVLRDVRWTFLLYVFGGCALVPWAVLGVRPLSRAGGLPLRAPGERVFAPTGLPLAFVLFGPVFLGIYALLRAQITAPEPYVDVLHALGWRDEHTTLYLVLFAIFVPLLEEWWWRAQALPRCVRAWGTRTGLLASAGGFALYHVFVLLVLYEPALALLRMSGIVIGGVVFTEIARRRGSWAWSLTAHFAADLVLVTAFLWWVRPAG